MRAVHAPVASSYDPMPLVEPGAVEPPSVLEALWRHKFLAALLVAVGGLIGYAVTLVLPEEYAATAQVSLRDPGQDLLGGVAGSPQPVFERFTDGEASALRNPSLYEAASDRTGEPMLTAEELRDATTVDVVGPGSVSVTARADSAEAAAARANAVATTFDQVRDDALDEARAEADRVIEEQRSALLAELDQLDQLDEGLAGGAGNARSTATQESLLTTLESLYVQRSQLRLDAEVSEGLVSFLDPASPPSAPVSPSPERNVLAGAMAGLFIALPVTYRRRLTTRAVEDQHAVSATLGVPVLAEARLPRRGGGELSAMPSPAYGFAAVALRYDTEPTVVVTSADDSDGSAITTLELGMAAARSGHPTLLIDANWRTEGLGRFLPPGGGAGLAPCLRGDRVVDDAISVVDVAGGASLSYLPAGTVDRELSDLVRGKAMSEVIERLRLRFAVIIIDTPSLIDHPDALSLAPLSDGMLLVVRRDTPMRDLDQVGSRLRQMPSAPLLGVLLTSGRRRRS